MMINIILLSDNQNIKSRDHFIMNLYRKTCFPYSYTADFFLSGFYSLQNKRENCSWVLIDLYQQVKRSTALFVYVENLANNERIEVTA